MPPSSPIAVAMVLMPTGPPLNLSIIVNKILLSISSKPCLSILSAFKPYCEIFMSILPSPLTCAKSLIRLNRALAIRGVPRERDAISSAAFALISTFKIFDDLFTIVLNV